MSVFDELSARGASSRQRAAVVAILCSVGAVSILCHAAYFLRFKDFQVRDSASYIAPAASFIRGDGFLNPAGQPDTRRTPGYPLVIAAFLRTGSELQYLIVFQHAIAVLLAIGVAAFTLRLTGRGLDAVVAGTALSLDPATLNAANSVLTETLFAGALALVCYALWTLSLGTRGARFVTSVGFIAGTTTLIRPIALLFVVPAAVFVLLAQHRRPIRTALTFVLAFSLVPLAWAGRNYRETGYFSVSSISGLTMVLRGAGTLAIDDVGDFDTNYLARRTQLEGEACDEIRRQEQLECANASVATRAAYLGRRGQEVVVSHPTAYARVVLRGAAMMMFGGDAVHVEQLVGRWATPILIGYGAVTLLLALVGVVRLRTLDRAFFYLACLTIGYFVVVSAGPEAYSRHRVPIEPLYAVLIGIGAGTSVALSQRRR